MRAPAGRLPAFPETLMKSPRRSRRPLFLLPVLAAVLATSSTASAAFVINEATGIFIPSYRGESNTTYFGWSAGSWDGNVDSTPPDPNVDIINGTPSINPGALAGSSFITQATAADIISGSNNVYSDVSFVNSLGLQMHIPTSGTVSSTGFTTIIIQGFGLSGAAFGFSEGLDGFGFGAINGILPEYVIGTNANTRGQWFAKWEIPGNAAEYTVDIIGALATAEGSVLSVTDLQVDTLYSTTGYAADLAVVPEPSALLLSFAGAGLLFRRRR